MEVDLSYDGKNRVTSLIDKVTASGSTLHSSSYQYDLLGNRTQITTDGATLTYTYDSWNQLTKVQQGATTLASYSYDVNGNRVSMVTSAGTTTSTYDTTADILLLSKTDPNGKVTTYTYDTNGSLTRATYDPSGVNQVTSYTYDGHNRLAGVTKPDGTQVQFSYDAEGHRVAKTVINGSTTVIQDVSALGHLAYQTDGAGNKLATFTYAANGVPSSVVIGSGTSTPRYYYVYNGQGDVVALVDSVGTVVASSSYDAFGNLTASSENLPNGWSNPYRYDGAEGVRYDVETGLYWLSVRAYDPTLGRFLSHDPLGRLAAWGVDFQPYVYASNNPVVNTDPTGLISCPIRIDGQCQSYWNTAPPDAPDIDGCSKPHPCKNPTTPTTPPPGGGGGNSHKKQNIPQEQDSPASPPPTDSQIGHARVVAGIAAAVFSVAASIFFLLSRTLPTLAVRITGWAVSIIAGCSIVAFICLAGATLLFATAAFLLVVAEAALQYARVLAAISLAFVAEEAFPNRQWTFDNVHAFGEGLLLLWGAASTVISVLSLFSAELPLVMGLAALVFKEAKSALEYGGLTGVLGTLTIHLAGRWAISYFIGNEELCLLRDSCNYS